MRIAIVGAGFTGLSAGTYLAKYGHDVTIFEAADVPGGLAAGFEKPDWKWSLEKHYHHLFTSDLDIRQLAEISGAENQLQFYSVNTSTRVNGKNFRLDSPISLLQFPALSFISKLRTGLTMVGLKAVPWQKKLDAITAKDFILHTMGKESWEILWQPLFQGKFGEFTDKINASWFWARIHVRSQQLGYPNGGFLHLSNIVVENFKNLGGQIHFSAPISKISQDKNTVWNIAVDQKKPTKLKTEFDQVLVTGPHTLLHKLTPQLPQTYTQSLNSLESLGAMTLVLELDQPFFDDNTYWLNINEKNWPFLAVVEHTNMAPSENYGNKHLLYVGKYLSPRDKQFALTKTELMKLYEPFLQKLSFHYAKHITDSWLFKEFYAQPIAKLNHHKHIPSVITPMKGLFWASMHHVYPWDRGTNYAVKLGRETAMTMMNSIAK